MKIGIIAPPWLPVPPRRYGGTENMIDGLCRGLAAQGHDVTLVAAMGSRCPVPTIPLRVSRQGDLGMGHALVEVPYALRAYDALEEVGVEVIHDHTQTGFLLANARRLPVITTNHNLFDAERQAIYAEAARRGIGVVAISKHHSSTATGAAPLAGIVHNGIDVDNIPVGKGDGGYACVLSRMSPAKGIREAILIAKNAGMPLRIAAKMQSSTERQYFKDHVYELIGGNVEYESEVSAREKYDLLGGACALINPIQWHEPFGLAMIEALATGTPVLATLMGAAPEIVTHGQTGFLRNHWSRFPPDLERIGSIDRADCRREAEERFGIARMASAYLELYRAQGQERAA